MGDLLDHCFVCATVFGRRSPGFDVLKTDTDLYADALAELLAAPTLPFDMVEEIEALGDAIGRRAETAGDRFDFTPVEERHRDLLNLAREVGPLVADSAGPDIDRAVLRVLRPLHRVLYSPLAPFHPDPGMALGLLPGLAPVRILASEDPNSDRFGFAYATLVRERNRLLEALARSIEETSLLAEALKN